MPGSNLKGSERSLEDFTAFLLAKHAYPGYDYDIQATDGGGSLGSVGPEPVSTGRDISSGNIDNAPPTHAPEPSSMFLLGTALVGNAVFGRKLKGT